MYVLYVAKVRSLYGLSKGSKRTKCCFELYGIFVQMLMYIIAF